MTNSTSSGPGDILSGLFKYNEEASKVNNKGSLYGPYASLLNNPFNPLYGQFYVGDKLGQGIKNAWQKKDIGAFFSTNFYHFYGYKNLDKMWGGKNLKWVLENFGGIDSQGNMSVGNFLLNIASIIPIGRVASLGVKYLPKAASALMKSGAVQALLKNGTVQTILKGANRYLIDPLKWLGGSVLDKIPKYLPNINLANIEKGIKRVSDLINGGPKAWIETASDVSKWLKNSGIGSRIGEFGKQLKNTWLGRKFSTSSAWLKNTWLGRKAGETFHNLFGYSKLYTKEIPTLIDGGFKLAKDSLKGGIDFASSIYSKMSPSNVSKWMYGSLWRMKNFGWLKKVTSTPLYKTIHGVLGPIIERNATLRSIRDATKKVQREYNEIKNQGIVGYTASKINNLKKAITDNKYVKTASKYVVSKINNLKEAIKSNKYVKIASKIVSKTKHELKQIKKQGIRKYVGNKIRKYGNRVRRYVRKTYHRVYRAVKRVYHRVRRVARRVYHYVRPVVNRVVSVARNVYNGVSNAVHGFASWLGFRGPSSSSSNFISRASGFTYQGYDGSRQSISQTIASMSGNCVDGTLAQISLARSFGIPAEMITTTWNGNPHVYGRINGVDRDIANHALTGSWSRPPAGPENNGGDVILQKGAVVVEKPAYNDADLEKKIEKVTLKVLDRESTFY